LDLVKKTLLGSILSNLLLVLGMSFFAGGLKRSEQKFQGTAALINVTMLFVGLMAFSLPTVFAFNLE
jgi:Ca2+:H+ antiporter